MYMTFFSEKKKSLSHIHIYEKWHKCSQSIIVFFYLGSYSDIFFFFFNNIHNAVYMLLVNVPKMKQISETNYEKRCSLISKTVPNNRTTKKYWQLSRKENLEIWEQTLHFKYSLIICQKFEIWIGGKIRLRQFQDWLENHWALINNL